jgi:hypothetical protein
LILIARKFRGVNDGNPHRLHAEANECFTSRAWKTFPFAAVPPASDRIRANNGRNQANTGT